MPTPEFIRHLGLTFVAEKPPPAHVFEQFACTGPGYPYFVRERADSEPEAGAFIPRKKSKFLSIFI
jgi:hypothetical protein